MGYRFADCELDEHLYQLRREGAPVALEPNKDSATIKMEEEGKSCRGRTDH